jgi:hypothetical protein
MRQVAKRHRIAVAIALAMVASVLALGRGLPGITLALRGPATHVCTCASGGDHATCPICNAPLTEHRRALRPAAHGVPCGDPRVAIGTPGEVSTLPSPLLALAPPDRWLERARPQSSDAKQVILEPSTPPPRRAGT